MRESEVTQTPEFATRQEAEEAFKGLLKETVRCHSALWLFWIVVSYPLANNILHESFVNVGGDINMDMGADNACCGY